MSRNIDKANTVLFRYQEQQAEANGYVDYNSTARPRNMKNVKTIKDAENWRKVIIKDINDKILRISSESNMSDYQIRDLNEELNKLCKEKYTYEYHILHNLNGPNYINGGGTINKYIETNSIKIKGYRYFGRARELSDVQELIQRDALIKETHLQNINDQQHYLKKTKELEQRVNVHYFGYLNDLNSFDDEKARIRKQNTELLNGSMDYSSDEEMIDEKVDSLSKAERKATRHRIKALRNSSQESNDENKQITLIGSTKPVENEDIQKFLVDKRRKELESKYNL